MADRSKVDPGFNENAPTAPVRRLSRGEHLTARHMNEIGEAVNALRPSANGATQRKPRGGARSGIGVGVSGQTRVFFCT